MALVIKEGVALATLTTFGIGGPSEMFADVRSEQDVLEAINFAKEKGCSLHVLAGGSNVLIPDGGLDGLVARIKGDLYSYESNIVDAWAGTNLHSTINAMGSLGYGGWEKLSGIPGSIGGAVRGNAGAFGPEIKDFVLKVRAVHKTTKDIKEFTNEECSFSYRHSFFKDNPEWVITRAWLNLQEIDPAESARVSHETVAERERRHLQNVRAAGSFFMNPIAPENIVSMFESEKGVKSRENRVPAGWLIEKAGMKGATVGDAIASLQHPNYIVNQGNATAHDVRNLAQQIKMEVYTQFDIELVEEAALF